MQIIKAKPGLSRAAPPLTHFDSVLQCFAHTVAELVQRANEGKYWGLGFWDKENYEEEGTLRIKKPHIHTVEFLSRTWTDVGWPRGQSEQDQGESVVRGSYDGPSRQGTGMYSPGHAGPHQL